MYITALVFCFFIFWLGSDEYDPVEMQRGPEAWWAAASQWLLSGYLVTCASRAVTFGGQVLPPLWLYWELHEGRDSLFHDLSWRPSIVSVWMTTSHLLITNYIWGTMSETELAMVWTHRIPQRLRINKESFVLWRQTNPWLHYRLHKKQKMAGQVLKWLSSPPESRIR